MTHKIYHSLIAALIGAATTGAVQAAPIPAMGLRFVAAEASDSSISVRSARVLPHERSMIVSMCIRVDRDLKGTESIELRPVLTDSTGHSAVLPSIFINGRTQHIAFQRDRRNAKRDLVTLRRRNGMEQTIDYLREVAYQPWMRKATLVLEEVACGCGIPIAYDSHAVATLRSDDTPRLAFRIPEVEEVKTRQESGRAFLAFQLGKSEILDNFRSNATELAKIMQAIDLVRNDSNVTVSHIAIHGYASPAGSLALNERLSAERTQALKSWVMSNISLTRHCSPQPIPPRTGRDWSTSCATTIRWRDERRYSISSPPWATWTNARRASGRNFRRSIASCSTTGIPSCATPTIP